MTFRLKILAYRKELKMTQIKFAKLVKVSVRTIKYWESGEITPPPDTAKAIEAYLDEAILEFNLTGKVTPMFRVKHVNFWR